MFHPDNRRGFWRSFPGLPLTGVAAAAALLKFDDPVNAPVAQGSNPLEFVNGDVDSGTLVVGGVLQCSADP